MLIKVEKDGTSLKKYLSDLGYSRRQITRMYTNNSVLVNGEHKPLTGILNIGDEIEISLIGKDEGVLLKKIDIIYQDDDVLIVNKPSGIVVHKDNEHKDNNLSSLLQKQIKKKVYPVLRLDKNVSGALVYALSSKKAAYLNNLREKGEMHKEYLAVVEGRLDNDEGEIRINIKKDIKRYKVSADGKKAVTEYKYLGGNKNYSLYLVNIITGRSHQIRLSFAHLGHPIAGDLLYGSRNRKLNRIGLHCVRVCFDDIDIKVNLPKQLEDLIYE